MTAKKDVQFSLEDCTCMEMMSPSKGQVEGGDTCAGMMSQFADSQGSGRECFEMVSRMMASCCGINQEDEEIINKA